MRLFGRRKSAKNRCPECTHYVMVEGYGYCAKDIPSSVNVRLLSTDGLKRKCPKCPDAMTCESWTAK